MHAAVAALARKHGWSASAASEVEALLSATASGGAASAVQATVLRAPGTEHTVFVRAEPASLRTTPAVGSDRYQVLGELGRGGMGAVQRVVDRWLNRVVARKVMHATLSESARARFLEEAQATAQLQHPGIVPVYDVGEEADGRLWFTMKEVRGETLRSVIRAEHGAAAAASGDRTGGLRRLVAIVLAVCRAVGFAHARGVIHRDLKPANVMVGSHGEVMVVDWGIAKVLSSVGAAPGPSAPEAVQTWRGSLEHTEAGSVFGTPAFMAPEQARGEVESVDARSDVYALGGILYEVLAGAPPYAGPKAEVLAAVEAGPPPSLRGPAGERGRSAFGVDLTELVEVCERAMARSPADRFPEATALAEAVQSWLDGSRRREQALAVVAAAAARGPEAAALRARAAALRSEAEAELAAVAPWQPEAEKAASWAKEDEAAALEGRSALASLEEESLLRASLTHAPELPEAHAALAERYRAEHAAAEAARTDAMRPEVLLRHHLAALPAAHPTRRSGAAYLRGDGALTLVTDPPGAEVDLYRYELRNRRLVAVADRSLGRTPLRAVSLPMGSWLCVVRHPERATVRYPVFVGRGEHWDGVPPGDAAPALVRLPRPSDLGPEDCHLPAGWFQSGGDPRAASCLPRCRWWVDGQVIRRFPVRNREYLAFLNALVAGGRTEAALAFAAREREGTFDGAGALVYGFDGARFSLTPDAEGDVWDPEWPAIQITWDGATAFAAWEAERTGLPWRLPGELVWEKAARGVDGRHYPWGDRADPSWACVFPSHRVRPLPAVVDSFPVDESVYGVRGLGGNVRDWCADAWRPEGWTAAGGRAEVYDPPTPDGRPPDRVGRGGSWANGLGDARIGTRLRLGPRGRFQNLGFRLARPLP